MHIRESAFAGSFYPGNRVDIEAMLRKLFGQIKIPGKRASFSAAYIVPHAGYVYSGKTAAYAYRILASNPKLAEVESIILIGPNHTGIGTPVSVSEADWETPIGTSSTDIELVRAICGASRIAVPDESAHSGEHSIEVQLPFLQYLGIDKRFVFVCMGDQSPEACTDLSDSITKAAESLNRHCVVIATSDFNHYESRDVGRAKDKKLFDCIEKLDYKLFNSVVARAGDSACGYGPITVAMAHAARNGASAGVLLDRSDSGEVTKEYGSVVNYASFAFF